VTSDLLRTNVEGTRNVLHSAVRASVGRVVYCSTVGTIGLSEDGNPCVEDMAWNAPALGLANGYLLSKRWAEDLVMTAAAAGVDAVVVNPTFMFGPLDSKPSSGRMIVEVASGRFLASTPGYNNFVDVRDVARGMILAAESGRAGERYILGGHDLTYHQAAEVIARVAGVRPPICTAPRLLARLVGWIGDSIEHLEPNLNSAAIAYAYTTRFRFSSDKARRELGYQAGPLEPAIADALRDFRARGLV
jgi:dihydroflavonol-4-reductase